MLSSDAIKCVNTTVWAVRFQNFDERYSNPIQRTFFLIRLSDMNNNDNVVENGLMLMLNFLTRTCTPSTLFILITRECNNLWDNNLQFRSKTWLWVNCNFFLKSVCVFKHFIKSGCFCIKPLYDAACLYSIIVKSIYIPLCIPSPLFFIISGAFWQPLWNKSGRQVLCSAALQFQTQRIFEKTIWSKYKFLAFCFQFSVLMHKVC